MKLMAKFASLKNIFDVSLVRKSHYISFAIVQAMLGLSTVKGFIMLRSLVPEFCTLWS